MTRIIHAHMIDRPIGDDGLPFDPADGYPRVVWRDPRRCGGTPCFYGRRVWPECVTARYANGAGEPMDEIIRDYDLNPEHVAAALRVFKPMLFSADMVTALLDGRKTQTRRLKAANVKPGDVLYVREAFDTSAGVTLYRADVDALTDSQNRWTPGIHMPAVAARLWLTVTSVRTERLGDISDADAMAEGFESRAAFERRWVEINGAWTPDQIVTVIEFAALTTAPLGWGDYLDNLEIKAAKKAKVTT